MVNSTREKILYRLLQYPRSTVQELADSVGINPISARHHLSNLQSEGLVTCEEVRHGIGRPRLVYTLTTNGQERFPTRYLSLVNRLLDQIKQVIPDKAKEQIFQGLIDEVSRGIDSRTHKYPINEKLAYAKELLAKEGFLFEWDKVDDEYQLHGFNCPYYLISQNHPELCAIDQALIANIFHAHVKLVSCIRNGDNFCTYIIT